MTARASPQVTACPRPYVAVTAIQGAPHARAERSLRVTPTTVQRIRILSMSTEPDSRAFSRPTGAPLCNRSPTDWWFRCTTPEPAAPQPTNNAVPQQIVDKSAVPLVENRLMTTAARRKSGLSQRPRAVPSSASSTYARRTDLPARFSQPTRRPRWLSYRAGSPTADHAADRREPVCGRGPRCARC